MMSIILEVLYSQISRYQFFVNNLCLFVSLTQQFCCNIPQSRTSKYSNPFWHGHESMFDLANSTLSGWCQIWGPGDSCGGQGFCDDNGACVCDVRPGGRTYVFFWRTIIAKTHRNKNYSCANAVVNVDQPPSKKARQLSEHLWWFTTHPSRLKHI